MSSKLAGRLALALLVAGVLPACGNINDGHPAAPFTILASQSTAGALANQSAFFQPVLSGDGRFVVFTSLSNSLVPGDTNGKRDIFRRNVETSVTEIVSVGVGSVPTDDDSQFPSVSQDGRWVAFESLATNLTGVAPGGRQVYVRDMNATVGTGIRMVSDIPPLVPGDPRVPGDDTSRDASISADGRYVAFASLAANFGDAHFNGNYNIYRRDLNGDEIILISANTSGGDPTPDFDGSRAPSISADGSRIAYVSDCTDLIAVDSNFLKDVFVTTVGPPMTTVIASPGPLGEGAGGESLEPSISGDGHFVAYESDAADLVAIDTNGPIHDIFVFDVDGGTVRLVSVNSAGLQGPVTEESHLPSISFDGRFVAFESSVSNLVVGDTNLARDVFVADLATGTVSRVSVNTSGQQSPLGVNSMEPSLSADGRAVAFNSDAAFVTEDSNGLRDVYVRTGLR